MKKLILACCLGAAVATAHAQAPRQEHNIDQRVTYMQKSLQLSDEQTQKIKPILEQSAAQRHTLMEKYKEQFKAFHNDMKNLDQQTHEQLAGVLTPSQIQALDTQRKAHKHFRRGHGHHPGGHHGKTRQDMPKS